MQKSTYYTLFNLEPSPILNQLQLDERYAFLQQKYHPDLTADVYDVEKITLINHAYEVLKNKDKSIEYFFTTNGLNLKDAKVEMDFLHLVVELKEKLNEVDESEKKIAQDTLKQMCQDNLNNCLDFINKKSYNDALVYFAKYKYCK